MNKQTQALALGLLVLCSSLARAGTVDCSNPATPADTLICGDETLRGADDELSNVYDKLHAKRESIEAEQTAWVRDVRDACSDAQCLSNAYLERIEAIEGQLKTIRDEEAAAAREVAVREEAAKQEAAQKAAYEATSVATSATDLGQQTEPNSGSESTFQLVVFFVIGVVGALVGARIGFWLGKMSQANVIYASSGAELAGKRIRNSIAPYAAALMGAGMGFVGGAIAAKNLLSSFGFG